MTIGNFNNSPNITETFIKGMAKSDNPTFMALNSKPAKLPFGKVLNQELRGASSFHALRRLTCPHC